MTYHSKTDSYSVLFLSGVDRSIVIKGTTITMATMVTMAVLGAMDTSEIYSPAK